MCFDDFCGMCKENHPQKLLMGQQKIMAVPYSLPYPVPQRHKLENTKIELIKKYLSRGRIDDFIEIIDLVYDIVKNKGTENIKECKNQVRYTIHLLIKNGWVQNNVKPKGRFIQAFNLFFGFKTNKNDLAAFDFPTTESRSLINTDYNSKFILVYEKLKDAVRIDSVE